MKSMRNLFSGVLDFNVRVRYLWTLLMATVLILMFSQPAYAEFNSCTTTRGVSKFVGLAWDSIVNPVKAYGWWVAAAVVILAFVASAASKGGAFWKAALWIVAAMTIGLTIAAQIKGPGTGVC